MAIHVTCACGKRLRASNDKAGKSAKCPQCGAMITLAPGAVLGNKDLSVYQMPAPPSPPKEAAAAHQCEASPRYWLLINDLPQGPFPPNEIQRQLVSGQVSGDAPACLEGHSDWMPLRRTDMLREAPPSLRQPKLSHLDAAGQALIVHSVSGQDDAAAARSDPIDGSPRPQSPATRPPWNPNTIGWLGVLFSPIWAGIMAALNGRRLGMSTAAWKPIALGVSWLVIDELISALVCDSNVIDLALYFIALWLIWFLSLRCQRGPYARHLEHAGGTARWLIPSLAGTPGAILLFVCFVIVPLIPPEPRQVCQQFLAARTEAEMRQYATANLWPALHQIQMQATPSGDESAFELTDEAQGPAEIGGYLVGYRRVSWKPGSPSHVEGVFHLVNRDNVWKIEEIYVTSVNHQGLPKWEPFSTLDTTR